MECGISWWLGRLAKVFVRITCLWRGKRRGGLIICTEMAFAFYED